jgi:IS5 family transposase
LIAASASFGATDAAAYEGHRLREGLLDKTNTASVVWADTATGRPPTRSSWQKTALSATSIARNQKGASCPRRFVGGNNAKSKIRPRIEHVFAEQKERMDLFLRTIGTARATTKIGLANLVYNIKRLLFLRRIAAA